MTGQHFIPGETVEFWLHSDPVLLGTATADAGGTVAASVTIPANTPSGTHHIELRGTETASIQVEIAIAEALSTTGADAARTSAFALALVLGGLALIASRRRLA